ncbi:DUF262 domain-containing protein [Massilia timonae]|uniref:GmrSD restriction endonucleases N-terminal domain-containing protein n=1 Tax=Massilia timonae TaxID=47229 RepID=A0A1S2N7C7_9BURK|nr:DUF262 domain-containing protein [Massilia timonae]OIJ40971.1 hypothetical protein LO55_1948 [Massilia timonae]
MTQEHLEFDVELDEPAEHQVNRDLLNQAVLYGTDWTVETAISQLRQENIFLQPTFQRRDAWRKLNKSRLIESILLGLPIPQIVLAERQDERGKFIVLDGKQRLLTLLQFYGAAAGSPNNGFALTGMEILKEFENLTFAELPPEAQRQFMNYAVRSSVIRNWPDSAFLEIVFIRLNEGSVKLSPQELRQAIATGPFTEYLEGASAGSQAIKCLLGLTEPDFRMRDAELLLRLVAFKMWPARYRGNMKEFLDTATRELNAAWDVHQARVIQVVADIEAAIEFGIAAFGVKTFGRKWLGDRFERPLNRAVIDVQVAYLQDAAVRAMLTGREPELVQEFQRVSGDPEFARSVESTTKSLAATNARFQLWGAAMSQLTGGVVQPLVIG